MTRRFYFLAFYLAFNWSKAQAGGLVRVENEAPFGRNTQTAGKDLSLPLQPGLAPVDGERFTADSDMGIATIRVETSGTPTAIEKISGAMPTGKSDFEVWLEKIVAEANDLNAQAGEGDVKTIKRARDRMEQLGLELRNWESEYPAALREDGRNIGLLSGARRLVTRYSKDLDRALVGEFGKEEAQKLPGAMPNFAVTEAAIPTPTAPKGTGEAARLQLFLGKQERRQRNAIKQGSPAEDPPTYAFVDTIQGQLAQTLTVWKNALDSQEERIKLKVLERDPMLHGNFGARFILSGIPMKIVATKNSCTLGKNTKEGQTKWALTINKKEGHYNWVEDDGRGNYLKIKVDAPDINETSNFVEFLISRTLGARLSGPAAGDPAQTHSRVIGLSTLDDIFDEGLTQLESAVRKQGTFVVPGQFMTSRPVLRIGGRYYRFAPTPASTDRQYYLGDLDLPGLDLWINYFYKPPKDESHISTPQTHMVYFSDKVSVTVRRCEFELTSRINQFFAGLKTKAFK